MQHTSTFSADCRYVIPNFSIHPVTFDVQRVTIYNGPGEISVTCCFAVGSQALGCHVLIYMSTTPVAFGDIRRENTTDSSSMEWYLSDSATGVFSGLEVGIYDVFLFDIERDNKLSANELDIKTVEITKPPTSTITDEPTDASTSATASEVTTATSTTGISNDKHYTDTSVPNLLKLTKLYPTELDATSTLVTTSVSPTNSNLIVVGKYSYLIMSCCQIALLQVFCFCLFVGVCVS